MSFPFDCITELIFVETEMAPSDVVLIPGASQSQLMKKAASLYHQGLAPYILPSGGVNPGLESTEWKFLRNVGITCGVPEGAILKEDKAKNTFENASFSLEVLRAMEYTLKK